MAETIELAKFGIDTKKVTEEAEAYKRSIDQVKAELKALRKEDRDTTAQQVKAEAQLQALNKEYRSRRKILGEVAQRQQKNIGIEERMEQALSRESVTLNELRASNREINAIRNEVNLETEEGRAQLEALNNALNENNARIKENVDDYTQQKIEIGNYKENVKEALDETDAFTNLFKRGDFKGIIVQMNEAGGASAFMSQGIKLAGQSIMAMTKASLAFIASPFGVVLLAIATAVLGVKKAIEGSTESTEKWEKILAPFQGILTAIVNVLQDLGALILDVILFAVDKLTSGFEKLLSLGSDIANFLGWDKMAKGMDNFADSTAEAIKQAQRLQELQREITELTRSQMIADASLRVSAERNKQIRDDETKSLEERIKAADRVQEAESQMIQTRKDLIALKLEEIQADIEAGGKSDELADERAELVAESIALNAEESNLLRRSQRRKQRVINEVEASQREAIQATMDKRIQSMEQEIALFASQQGFREKTAEEELEYQREMADKQMELLNTKLENQLITETEYRIEINNITNELNEEQAQILMNNALKEIEIIREQHQERINEEKYLTEQLAQERIERNNELLEKEKEYEQRRLELGLISEDEYNELINEKKDEIREANAEIEAERRENEKEEELERRAMEFDEEIERMKAEGATMFEIERAQKQEQYDLLRQDLEQKFDNDLISQEQYNRESKKLDKDLADAKISIANKEKQQQLQVQAGLMNAVAGLIDQDSKAFKAISLAKAFINFKEAITKDLALGFPTNVLAVARDTAIGLATIKDITSTNIPSASGGGSVGSGSSAPQENSSPNIGGGSLDESATILNQLDANENSNTSEETRLAVESGARQGIQDGMVDLTENRQVQTESEF